MKLDLLAQLNADRAARRAVILITDTETGEQRLIREDDIAGSDRADLYRGLIRSGRSRPLKQEEGGGFANVLVPPAKLVLIGAVHISQVLAPMAGMLGYDVTIVDPRTAFATMERFPQVDLVAEWPDAALPDVGVDRWTAFCALTHDPKIDDPGLLHALEKGCFYIGALGSKKTHARRVERLTGAGIADADIARIHAPIGLAIGAQSPAEIAVSIMAQITAALRLGEG
ncbi:XdhC family protein [Microbaculum marinisediminis]|uniref:XdhC family protein n=1 Tax=Microbaculum marinisediminis TaxID=2931392 RepID=A0AAW5R2N8_9HYPH|nr:XdhC family protein [Microbaculum sp. A6E488]MCT8972874.1 XdhC family protein [Microbaculum sp. A6E488]